MSTLEKMDSFFEKRVEEYDEHMLCEVEGCKEGYIKMAQLIPDETETLLDLGCGTGLELDEIFKTHPDINVTGIDITEAMLKKLKHKHPNKRIKLICGDYFKVDFEKERYDCAVSFQTMHHFSPDKKTDLYKKIYSLLKEKGIYIECDYMVLTQQEEDLYFSENKRKRKEQGIPDDVYCHYDTPCTVDNQIMMLKKAGFKKVTQVFRIENTTMLLAEK